MDAGLGQACGLGQALSDGDSRVRVSLEGGAQQLHVFFGEAGPLPATGGARGAVVGGHRNGVICAKKRKQIVPSDQTGYTTYFLAVLSLQLHKDVKCGNPANSVLVILLVWVTVQCPRKLTVHPDAVFPAGQMFLHSSKWLSVSRYHLDEKCCLNEQIQLSGIFKIVNVDDWACKKHATLSAVCTWWAVWPRWKNRKTHSLVFLSFQTWRAALTIRGVVPHGSS